MSELFFLASPTRDCPDRVRQLVRMKTSVGAPHVAFGSRVLAEEFISAPGMGLNCEPVYAGELTADIQFDTARYGVLVIESPEVMRALIDEAPSFDYEAHVRIVELEVTSSEPW